MLLGNFFKIYLLILLLIAPAISANEKKQLWKITSNSSVYNLTKKTIIYSGNALFETNNLSIHGDEIRAKKITEETREIQISGSFAKLVQYNQSLKGLLELNASEIHYQLDERVISAKKNILFIQKKINESQLKKDDENIFFKVVGEQLNLSMEPYNLVKIKGSPLELEINQPNQATIIAQANEMSYNQQSSQFEISGNVILFTGRENITASKVLYNSETRTIQIPESQDQKVEMTQTEEKINE